MKKILLPTDFSPNSINAIHYALDLFKDEKCIFYLLNVYRVPYVTSQDVAYVNTEALIDLEEGLKKTSEERLKELVEKLMARGNKNHLFEAESDYNFLSDSVKKIVKEKEIDLIEEKENHLKAFEFKWNPEKKVKFPSDFQKAYPGTELKIIHPDNFEKEIYRL